MRSRLNRRLLPLYAFLFLLPFLLPGAGFAVEDPGARDSLERGIEMYRAGQPEEALTRLRGFVLRHSGSTLLPEAYLYLARIFQESDRSSEALLYLERIPPDRRTPEVQLIEGAARVANGEAERGIELLLPLESEKLSNTDRRLRLSAMADAQIQTGRPLQALFFLSRLLQMPGAGSGENLLQEAHVLLRDRLSDAELAEAVFMFGGTQIGEDARLQMALRAFSRGEVGQARQLAETIVQGGIPFPYRRDAVLLRERLVGNEWLERSIGAILPLSGRYAPFGELVRRGMEIAMQVHSDSAVRMVFIDGDADPARSAQAVSDLARSERVMAIAGPLTGAAAAAAAERAQEERVPLLALSQKDGLAEIGPYAFRNSLTNRLQAQVLANYTVKEKGLATFAVLYPENRLGREMAELFAQEVEARGGLVVDYQGYAENETDFRTQVRLLQGKDPNAPDAEPEEKRLDEDGEAEPPFDALFIPDYADRVGLILPQLEFYGLEPVQLLGINGWHSPELLRLAGKYVEGAILADGFFRYSPFPFVQEFVNLYFEKYGEEPSILEAQGFDAASILISTMGNPEIRTREDLRLALSRLHNYPGITGATSFNDHGDAEKILFLLQVQNGNFVQLN